MKNYLLIIIFIIVFSNVKAQAQIFIPTPPAIYIPQLDPVYMHIQNQVFQNMMRSASVDDARGERTNSAKTTTYSAGYTTFNPRRENYLPKLLAQSNKASAADQRQAEQFFNQLIVKYEQATPHHKMPKNDIAYAFLYFILTNYEVYYDLFPFPVEKDPRTKYARNESERAALLKEKSLLPTTVEEDEALYEKFREMLSAKPEVRKMTDADKQKVTETFAILSGIVNFSYDKAVKDGNDKLVEEVHLAAKQNLEGLLGISMEQVKKTLAGARLQ